MSNPARPLLQLEFDNLPLVEAAVRATFDHPIEVKFAVINAVHERLRDKFPELTEPDQLEAAPGSGETTFTIRPGTITGAVYCGHADGLRITLQGNVAIARWVKKTLGNGAQYPRYAALREALWRTMKALAVTIESAPSVAVVNMSYVNFIHVPQPAQVLSTYFSERVQVLATAEARDIHKVDLSWRDPDDIDLRFRVEKVAAKSEQSDVVGYNLTTVAGTRIRPAVPPEEVLDDVHQRLQFFFRDLISDHARQEWGLHETCDE